MGLICHGGAQAGSGDVSSDYCVFPDRIGYEKRNHKSADRDRKVEYPENTRGGENTSADTAGEN